MTVFTVGSLFAGIGGIDLAFMNAGFSIQWQVEIDEFCQRVLAKNFPGVARYKDIRDCHHLPYVDVITAGFPCQPFSVAGKGMGDNDDRYLVPEMLRVIYEVQPYMVFLENVPRFATLEGGRYFALLLRWFAESGYAVQWHNIAAADVGAPHKRERWFCVAYRTVSNAQRQRRNTRGKHRQPVFRHNRVGKPLQTSVERYAVRHESDTICSVRSANKRRYSQSFNAKRCWKTWKQFTPAWGREELPRGTGGGARQAASIKSGLGRTTDGIPYRVDRHQFPAPRNLPQYDWESARTTDRKENRRARITALGNAVVPQVIYPVACEMMDYLNKFA